MAAGSHEDEPKLPPASGKRLPHLLQLEPLHPGGKAEPVPQTSPLLAARETHLGSIFFFFNADN